MWRFAFIAGLCALGGFLVILVPGDGGSSEDCGISLEKGIPTGEPPLVSLEEAQDAVDFRIKTPSTLPDDVSFDAAQLNDAWRCRSATWVALYYQGKSYRLSISEMRATITLASPSDPIVVNGERGTTSSHVAPDGTVTSIIWRRGDVTFLAEVFYEERLPRDRFLEILNSIP